MVMFLICHVTFHDHIIKGSCDFLCGSPSRKVTILPSLVTIRIMIVDMFLVVDEQNSTCSLTSTITIFSKARSTSCSHTKFQNAGTRSFASATTKCSTGYTLMEDTQKYFASPCRNTVEKEKKQNTRKSAIGQLFALHANAIKECTE